MIETEDDLRDLLDDLRQVAGLGGFGLSAARADEPGKVERGPALLESPADLQAMLKELFVDALGMEVRGL